MISSTSRRRRSPSLLVVLAVIMLSVVGASEIEAQRTWTSADGKFSIEAQLVRVQGDSVVLQRADGKQLTVPIDKLSDADRRFVRPPSKSATAVESEAENMPSAAEAVLVYQMYLARASLSASERLTAEARRDHWQKLADEDYQRVGKKWMAGDEAEAVRKKARDKIDYGFEMLRLGNGELSEKALREASRLDPDNITADFVMGMVYSIVVDDDRKAIQHFEECLERDPNNVGALNNLAVCKFYERDFNGAVRHWLQAVEISPETPSLAQNIGSFITLASRTGQVRVSKRRMEALAAAYEELITEHNQKRPSAIGFRYMPPVGIGSKKDKDRAAGGQLVVVGSGTGFVIAPHLIATNYHVIEGADQLVILDPSNPRNHLAAEVIAVDKKIDVAVLKCPGLNAPPLVLCDQLPPRGSDIMVLGYPLGSALGSTLKSTRGAMVALPDAANDGLCLYDALTNPGNSGGPLVDREGRVVAVVRAITGYVGGSYGAAIPMQQALPFFKKHAPDLKVASGDPRMLDWPAVDAAAAPSTVLIIQKQSANGSFGD